MTTIRPNTTVSGRDNYTVTNTATAYTALNDDDDSTFIRKTGDGTASIVLGFGTFSIAASQRVKQVRVRTKARTTESDSKIGFQLGTTVAGLTFYGPAYTLRGVNASAIYEGPYYATAPNGGAWDQGTVDALRVQITDYRANASRGYVYELYADVDLANQPSASVASPSGSVTDTSAPGVSWEFTDPDGDAQSYYRVKVYSDAQYLAADFDPDESTATWDSGDINSGDVSTTVGSYLVNDTYRAYVKVAKNVNGSPFWSAWAFSSFVLNVSPPTTPSLSATFDEALNRVSLEATGASAAGFDYQRYVIQRSTDEVTWVDVRDADELVPNNSYLATIIDYEAPRGSTAYYRVRSVGTASANFVASDWSSSASVSVTNDGDWWWKAIASPSLNKGAVRVLDGIGETVEEDLGVFRPLGRSTALVVSGSIFGRDGAYTVACFGDTEFDGVYNLARHQGVILVQDPFGDQKYVRFTSRSFSTTGAASTPIRRVAVSYVEVSGA
jgi:hypothetical protein